MIMITTRTLEMRSIHPDERDAALRAVTYFERDEPDALGARNGTIYGLYYVYRPRARHVVVLHHREERL